MFAQVTASSRRKKDEVTAVCALATVRCRVASRCALSAANSVPYGARLRIRDDRLTAVLAAVHSDAARVVVHAMHDYGIILSDGGNIALTAEDDERTTAKWDTVMGTGLDGTVPG